MTVFRMMLRELLCDYPGCDATDGSGGGDSGARDLRRDCKQRGWIYRNGKDFCSEHARTIEDKEREKS